MRLSIRTDRARPAAHAEATSETRDDHELVGQAREHEAQRLAGRDRAATLALAALFTATAAALTVWAPSRVPAEWRSARGSGHWALGTRKMQQGKGERPRDIPCALRNFPVFPRA